MTARPFNMLDFTEENENMRVKDALNAAREISKRIYRYDKGHATLPSNPITQEEAEALFMLVPAILCEQQVQASLRQLATVLTQIIQDEEI